MPSESYLAKLITIDEICAIADKDWNYKRNILKRTKHSTINILLSKNYPIYSFNANKQPIMCETYGSRLVDAIQLTHRQRIHTMDYTSKNYAIICGDSMMPDKRAVLALDFDFYNNNPDNYNIQFMNEIYRELMSIYQTSDTTNEEDIHKLIPGFATSSTEGNYNMFIEFDFKGPEDSLCDNRDLYHAYCRDIIQKAKCNKIVIDHLEVALSDCYQVLPPSETISKKTRQPNPRKYLSNQLFYTIQSTNDPIYQLLIKIVDKHDEIQQNKMKERAQQQTSFAPESNEEQIKKATYYIQEGLKENLFSKYPERKDWISLGYAIKCIFGEADGLDAFLLISEQWDKYDESQYDYTVDTFNSLNIESTDVNFSIGRIYNHMKSNDKEKAKEIMSTYYRTILQPAHKKDSTELDTTLPIIEQDKLANYFDLGNLMVPILRPNLKFVEKSNRDLSWYIIDANNLWRQSDSIHYMITNLLQILINNSSLSHKEKLDNARELLKTIDKETDKMRYKEQTETIKNLAKTYAAFRQAKDKYSSPTEAAKFIQHFKTSLLDTEFASKLDIHPKKWAFQNGMLDIETLEFTQGIQPSDYLTDYLSIDYVPYDKDNTDDVNKRNFLWTTLKKILNNNDTHLNYFLSLIGHSYLGIPDTQKSIYFCVDEAPVNYELSESKGNNGKSVCFEVLQEIMPYYTDHQEPNFIEENNTAKHKQMPNTIGKRFVWIDELPEKKLDKTFIKRISNGKKVKSDALYKNTETIKVHFKLWVCTNTMPQFTAGANDAVYNRYTPISFQSKFLDTITEDDYPNKRFIKDVLLCSTLINNYALAIIQLILEYSHECIKNNLKVHPQPPEFDISKKNTTMSNDIFLTWFNEECQKGEDFKVAEQILFDTFNRDNPNNRLPNRRAFRKKMVDIGYTYDKDLTINVGHKINIKGCYRGINLISKTEIIEDDITGKRSLDNSPDQQPSKKQCQNERNQCATPGHEDLDNEYDY